MALPATICSICFPRCGPLPCSPRQLSSDASAISASRRRFIWRRSVERRHLRSSESTGSIETGKLADLACVDLSSLNSQPVYDVVSQLVYAVRADQVTDVWVGGRHQLDNGQFAHIDTDSLLARCNEWRERIAATGEIQ